MRTVILQLVNDTVHNDMLGVIPSTYNLCRMYDNKSVQFSIISGIEDLDLSNYKIYLVFMSGDSEMGRAFVSPDIDGNYLFELSGVYTTDPKLQVQVELLDAETLEHKYLTNIITFKLGKSIPLTNDFITNLIYLNRLVMDGLVKLKLDEDELVISDNLDVELLRLNISIYVNPVVRNISLADTVDFLASMNINKLPQG